MAFANAKLPKNFFENVHVQRLLERQGNHDPLPCREVGRGTAAECKGLVVAAKFVHNAQLGACHGHPEEQRKVHGRGQHPAFRRDQLGPVRRVLTHAGPVEHQPDTGDSAAKHAPGKQPGLEGWRSHDQGRRGRCWGRRTARVHQRRGLVPNQRVRILSSLCIGHGISCRDATLRNPNQVRNAFLASGSLTFSASGSNPN